MSERHMGVKHHEIYTAVQAGLLTGAAALVGVAGTALAQNTGTAQANGQNAKPKTLQTVVVTGSHIRRVDVETDNPVVNVTPQEIQATGKLTVGGVLQTLPAITGGITSPNVGFGGGSGKTLIGLRGLGASRTLILIDGQRIVNKDLNAIPTVAIQSIQVLTSGASAIYGSDAIGGVINIILKSNFQGAQFSANTGISSHGDAQRNGASFIYGNTSDKGSLVTGVSYNQFQAVRQGRRSFSKNSVFLTTTANGGFQRFVAGSTNALRDFLSVGPEIAGMFGCSSGGVLALNPSSLAAGTSPTGPSDYHCFNNKKDQYNFASAQLLQSPSDRTNAFVRGKFHLTQNIDFFSTLLYNHTRSAFNIAPDTFNTGSVPGVLISKDSYYNPFGVNFSQKSGAIYKGRLVPMGDRKDKFGHSTLEAMVGLRGHFSLQQHPWTWDVGIDYGHTDQTVNVFNLPVSTQLVKGLGPSFKNKHGVVQCGTKTTPIPLTSCTPWDPFNVESPSAVAELTSPEASRTGVKSSWQIERIYHADVSGGLFDLPAGTVQAAAGLLYRKEYANNAIGQGLVIPKGETVCILGSSCSSPVQGGFDVKTAYGELLIPVLKDMPFVHGLYITLADRYSKFSDFGHTNNWKFGVEYRPIQSLLLRGTVSSVFRAPTVTDVFGAPPNSAGSTITTDPCDFIAPTPSTPNPHAGNPACVGVPATGSFTDRLAANGQQFSVTSQGSATSGLELGPEKGMSFDYGVVYSPSFVPGLTVSGDVWRIYLKNRIGVVGPQGVINQCFFGQTQFCRFITRAQGGVNAGRPLNIFAPAANLGRIDVKGLDFAGHYRLPHFSFGQFTVAVNLTYMDQFTIQTAPGLPSNQVFQAAGRMGWQGSALGGVCPAPGAGEMCFYPRWRGQANINWRRGPWSALWTLHYIGRFRMADTVKGRNAQGIDVYGSNTYSDITLGYNISAINTRVNLGADNVLNRKPPLLFDNRSLNANTAPAIFDTIGRFYWLRATVTF